MLTISKPLSATQAQSYHAREFTSAEQSYWSQDGAVRGEWRGKLATKFGLTGEVGAEEFARLSDGQHPHSRMQLVRHHKTKRYENDEGRTVRPMEHRAGWDATFSAPKSVSLTALVGGDARVREAHREAVDLAIGELERYTQARLGGNRQPETTGQFVAAKFEHDTARPVDGYAAPQLHTHVVLFNMTEDAEGRVRAIQEKGFFDSQSYATAIYQSHLMYRLRELGYETESGRSGAPEIRGYSNEYLEASSPRSQQIRAYLERTGKLGSEAAEIAAHSTRDKKEIHSTLEVMAAHRRIAVEYGNQAEAVVLSAQARRELRSGPTTRRITASEAVNFSGQKNFEREAAVDERTLIRDSLRRGMGEVTHAEVRADLNARLASGEFLFAGQRKNTSARQLTTADTIEAEREIQRRVAEGRNQVAPVLTRREAIAAADRHPHLNRSQKTVVEDVLSAPDRIQGLQGYAGVGKTTTLSALRSELEVKGYTVEGLAPTSRATRQLGEAGVDSTTLQSFLARTPRPDSGQHGHFYFVDESSLASTNQMRVFLERLGPQDRALLIGDIRQHQGVEAGRPFEQLQQAGMRTAYLDQIVRQKDPGLKSAVEHLAKGEIAEAFELLQHQTRIHEIRDDGERIRAIASAYAESPERTMIVSPDNASRRALNVAVREQLKLKGALAPNDRSIRVLIPRQEMTGAERTWASGYEIGDVIRYSRGSKILGIEAGSYGTVVAVDPNNNLLFVKKSNEELATYDPRRLSGVSAYREVAYEFSAGDQIQFTAPDKTLKVANRDLAVIDSIGPDGRMAVHLDNNRKVEFDCAQHRHFDHGYAVTSYSSQGLTAERVLVNADTGVHADLLNSRFGYVSISRASHGAMLFTDDMNKLRTQLSADVSKTSALDIKQTAPVALEIGIGMGI